MTAQGNRLLTQQLTTSGDSQYSGININVNGGHVCLLINQDINNEKIWTLVSSVTKTKRRKYSVLKEWFLKKFTSSAEDVTTAFQESSCDATSSSSREFQSENKEHSLNNGVKPVTKDEYSSVLADDDCACNHSLSCLKFENRANLIEPTTQSITREQEEDKENTHLLPENYANSRNCNARELTVVKQLARHQEDLHLRCGTENSSDQTLEPLKLLSGKNPVDESYNNRDKSVNVESPDSVSAWSETSFTSGYPDKTRSSLHLPSNDSFSMCSRNSKKKEGCQKDQCVEEKSFQSKTSEADEESELNNLSSIEENSFQTKTSDADEEIKLTRKPMSDSLVADDISACPDSCSSQDTEEEPIGNQNEKSSHSTLPSSCDVVVASQKKKTRTCKKRYREKCKISDLPHKETSSPPCGDKFNVKQFCSNLADSSICASLDHDTAQKWHKNDVDSEVTDHPKMKKKIKSSHSLRHVKNSYSFKKQCKEFFRNQQKKKVKSIVRELRVEHRYLQFVDFGLDSYFDRLNNGSPPSLHEQMRYEWLRLASFQHYTGAGNALNLSRNGFYNRHTDGPSSTRCAYCDVTHSNWEYFDNIETIHRQLSPSCPFHGDRSDESLNVSINCDGPRSTISETANQNSNFEPSTSENSAVKTTSAGSTYTQKPSLTLASAEVTRGLENTSVSQANPSNTNGESVSQQPTEDPEGRERRTGERVSGLARTSNNAGIRPVNTESLSNRSQAGAGNFVDPVGKHAPQTPASVNRDSTPTTLDNVKHPEYRTMAQRVNSFHGFPNYLDQTPEQMALAGFYFVGVADFTRCFCCGGGLRNWEAGDDPLLEHTRWFPRCEYVLRLKGERYVAAVQRRHQEHMEQQRQQQIEIANQRDANRNPPDPMTTDAASVMREMGYADQRIRETILAVRRQIGTHMITTQQVLSWLLDQDDESTTTTAASSMYQTGNETNSIYTGINMASEQDDSSYTTAAQSSINTTVSTTTLKTRESGQGSGAPSGSKSATAASSGKENQQTDTTSTAPGDDTSLVSGPSSQTGAKRNSKKKKAKGNTKTGQPAGATGGPGTDTARKLRAENEKLRDMQTCKICMERPVNTTMLPCGHLVCCDICASRLRDCPVCRKRIKGTVKTFMS